MKVFLLGALEINFVQGKQVYEIFCVFSFNQIHFKMEKKQFFQLKIFMAAICLGIWGIFFQTIGLLNFMPTQEVKVVNTVDANINNVVDARVRNTVEIDGMVRINDQYPVDVNIVTVGGTLTFGRVPVKIENW